MSEPSLHGERLTLRYIELAEAVLWDDNPKLHDIEGLAASIQRYGFVDPPKFDASLSAMVYGNGRTHVLRHMKESGEEAPRGILIDTEGRWYVPVAFGLDQASQQAARALAVDHNNLTVLGGAFTGEDLARLYDPERYAALLEAMQQGDVYAVTTPALDVEALLQSLSMGPAYPAAEAPSARTREAEQLRRKWQTEPGQLWHIPSTSAPEAHRLLCGDSTRPEDVARLMNEEQASLAITSPPYWVGKAYEEQTSKADVVAFIDEAAAGLCQAMRREEARIVINTGTARRRAVEGEAAPAETWLLLDWWASALRRCGWLLRHCRTWSKNGGLPAVIGPATDVIDQHWEFVATFYDPSARQRGQHRVEASWAQQGIWTFHGEADLEGHGAKFPLELPRRNVALYADERGLVYEPFSGEGTTTIACETLGRLCYAMEIDPGFVAVTLERLSEMGLEPVLDH